MYKFEILADSVQELQQKKMVLAQQWISEPINELNKESVAQAHDTVTHFPVYTPSTNFNYDEDVSKTPEAAPVVASQPSQTQQTEVDTRGLPWDTRIHAATRVTKQDGTWRNKRGVDDALVKQVEQELIAAIKVGAPSIYGNLNSPMAATTPALPTPQFIVPPPPAPTVAVAMPTFDQRNTATPWANQAPGPAAVAAVPQEYQTVDVPEGVRPAYSLSSFKANLTIFLSALIDQGKIDQNYINELKEYFKVKEIWNILGNEASCIELWNTFGSIGYITKVDE